MPAKKPGLAVRMWISSEDNERVRTLADAVELTQVEIMTRILHAGIDALYRNGKRLTLPLRFNVQPGREEPEGRYPAHEPTAVALNEKKKRVPNPGHTAN